LPVFIAVDKGNRELKADVNNVNCSGDTPLYKATDSEMLDIVVKMLQMYGGNPNKVGSKGSLLHINTFHVLFSTND